MDNLIPIIISLAGGILGANLALVVIKEFSMGPLLNTLAGFAGGLLGGSRLDELGLGSGAIGASMEISNIIANLIAGGVGGAILALVLGYIKRLFAR